MKRLVVVLLLSVGVALPHMMAQNSVNMNGQTTNITNCNLDIYDNGGPNGNYGSLRNDILTVYPESGQGRISLEVLNLDIHHNDTLFIYDGPTTSGTLLATLNNSTYNSMLNTDIFMATESNTSGALTLRFKSSYFISIISNHGSGFKLHASCVATCNPFQIILDTARCSHIPVQHTDNYYYIDLCPDEEVHLAVKGIYSNQETAGYVQSDATTTFTWFLEPEIILSGDGMDSISHVFTPNMGQEVIITARDTLSCPAQYPITFRVRTSHNPIQHISDFPPLCVGQSFTPGIGYENGQNIMLQEVGFSQHATLRVNDTVFLPDGISCPPYGIYYRSNVTFTEFAPGATITSANDILYVRIKMEHSAIEDLKIDIYCPNGSSSTILPNPNHQLSIFDDDFVFFRVNLGSAYRPDVVSCNSSLNPMGDPWNYAWSNNNSLGYQYASNGSCYHTSNFHSHYNPHWDDSNYNYFNDTQHSFSVDSSNMTNMTQIYHPYQNFNTLIGCPLNGNWYIQVQDMMEEDNGYIVEWELALDPELLPSVWDYTINVDSIYFTGNQVINHTTLQPDAAGLNTYGLTIVDDFGCRYDTIVHITTYELPEVSLGDDRQICSGESVTLAPDTINNTFQYLWNTGATTPTLTVSTTGTYSLSASILSNNNILCQSSDTVTVTESSNLSTELDDVVCAGHDFDGYNFHVEANTYGNNTFYSTSQNFTSQSGCDSLVTLNLTILPRIETVVEVNACEQYTWEGETYTESGEYTREYTSADGCDSTSTLILSIGYPIEGEVWETSCGPYLWQGDLITESGDYTKIIPSSHDCDSTVTLHLTVVDTSLISYNSNPNFCETSETILAVEGNFDNYVWNTGDVTPSILVTTSGYYTVTASNYACERVVGFLVPTCTPTLLLPNAITPGKQDGLNDCFRLSDYDRTQIDEFHIYIYNRWGELVFVSNDKHFEWDGSQNGKHTLNTVYSYILRCTDHNGKAYHVVGTITVL